MVVHLQGLGGGGAEISVSEQALPTGTWRVCWRFGEVRLTVVCGPDGLQSTLIW